MPSKFPYEPWSVTEEGFRPADLAENESVFALGNGFIGLRGNLEEGGAAGAVTIQGSYLNGVFDSEPIRYGETAYGYAKNHETICSVMDAKGLLLCADGERLDAGSCELSEHRRILDMRSGLLRRRAPRRPALPHGGGAGARALAGGDGAFRGRRAAAGRGARRQNQHRSQGSDRRGL